MVADKKHMTFTVASKACIEPHPTGGGGHSTHLCTGRLRPEVQPLTLLYTIFDRKGTPFIYPPLKNGTPFTYLLKSTASLFLTLGRKSSCRFHVAFNKLK